MPAAPHFREHQVRSCHPVTLSSGRCFKLRSVCDCDNQSVKEGSKPQAAARTHRRRSPALGRPFAA